MVKVSLYLEGGNSKEEEIERGFIIGPARLLLNPLRLKPNGLKYPINGLP
jgi:hypothetical protein